MTDNRVMATLPRPMKVSTCRSAMVYLEAVREAREVSRTKWALLAHKTGNYLVRLVTTPRPEPGFTTVLALAEALEVDVVLVPRPPRD